MKTFLPLIAALALFGCAEEEPEVPAVETTEIEVAPPAEPVLSEEPLTDSTATDPMMEGEGMEEGMTEDTTATM